MSEWNSDLDKCPSDKFVHVISDGYKRYKVAKHCSCCGLWSDEDGNPVYDVSDWRPYINPADDKRHKYLDKIINAWLDENYELKHKQNSVRKHLNVDNVEDCTDLPSKENYYRYLMNNVI